MRRPWWRGRRRPPRSAGGSAPSTSTTLAASAITTQRRGGLPHQLLAQQGRAAALDQRQARADLVGAVDGEVDGLGLVEVDQRAGRARGARPAVASRGRRRSAWPAVELRPRAPAPRRTRRRSSRCPGRRSCRPRPARPRPRRPRASARRRLMFTCAFGACLLRAERGGPAGLLHLLAALQRQGVGARRPW